MTAINDKTVRSGEGTVCGTIVRSLNKIVRSLDKMPTWAKVATAALAVIGVLAGVVALGAVPFIPGLVGVLVTGHFAALTYCLAHLH